MFCTSSPWQPCHDFRSAVMFIRVQWKPGIDEKNGTIMHSQMLMIFVIKLKGATHNLLSSVGFLAQRTINYVSYAPFTGVIHTSDFRLCKWLFFGCSTFLQFVFKSIKPFVQFLKLHIHMIFLISSLIDFKKPSSCFNTASPRDSISKKRNCRTEKLQDMYQDNIPKCSINVDQFPMLLRLKCHAILFEDVLLLKFLLHIAQYCMYSISTTLGYRWGCGVN